MRHLDNGYVCKGVTFKAGVVARVNFGVMVSFRVVWPRAKCPVLKCRTTLLKIKKLKSRQMILRKSQIRGWFRSIKNVLYRLFRTARRSP